MATLTAFALLMVSCGSTDATQDAGPAKPKTDAKTPPRIPSAKNLPRGAHAPDFAPDASGFALLAECPESDEQPTPNGCPQRVLVLDKGARTWRVAKTSPMPNTPPDKGVSADLFVLGSGRALIREGRSMTEDRTWYTGDGGDTWREGKAAAVRTTSHIPEGGRLLSACLRMDEEDNGCARTRLEVIMPESGEYRVLATQPPLGGEVDVASETGRDLYAYGESSDTRGTMAMAVSRDRGRTWRESLLPDAAAERLWHFVVVSGRGGTFALELSQLPPEEEVKNGLRNIHRLKPDGSSWERVWTFRPGVEPRSSLGAVAADDKTLTIWGERGVWTSSTGGRSFQPRGDSTGPAGSIRQTPAGWLWSSSFGEGSYRISKGGVRWHSFQLP